MATFYVKNEQINEETIQIIGEDYHHLKDVLRTKIGEKVKIYSEDGTKYETKVESFVEGTAICKIETKEESITKSALNITLYQGLPKADKLEWIIQKTTELGVNTIIPVEMTHSVAKFEEKNRNKKLERWNKISLEASKQCGRASVPEVLNGINFKNIIENISKYDIVLLPYENEKSVTIKEALEKEKKNKTLKNIAIVIGPEGGFSVEEVNSLVKHENVSVVTLGPRILRTETASIATLAMVSYALEL